MSLPELKDEIHVFHIRSTTAQSIQGSWTVYVTINDSPARPLVITEPPGTEAMQNYVAMIGEGLRRYHQDGDEEEDPSMLTLHHQVFDYARCLLNALKLDTTLLGNRSTICRIHIHEKEPKNPPDGEWSIHRLHWEAIEGIDVGSLPFLAGMKRAEYQFRIHRHLDFPDLLIEAPETLQEVQLNLDKTFNILLVIARDLGTLGSDEPYFEPGGIASDISPDLAQWPLMRIQSQLKREVGPRRVSLDIVRPGSLDELKQHIKRRFSQDNLIYHLMHLDLHGKSHAGSDQIGPYASLSFQDPAGTMDTKQEKSSSLVAICDDYKIENVVTNACWSAYTGHGQRANTCRVLLRNNRHTRSVTEMWAKASGPTIATYLHAFYQSLLVECQTFDDAAQAGREALRSDRTRWPSSYSFQPRDDIMCIQYSREPQRDKQRQRGLTLSLRGFPWSNFRLKGFKRPPRLGSVPTSERRPVPTRSVTDELARLELKFLQLEHFLLQSPNNFVIALDSYPYREAMTKSLKALAFIWVETNFIRATYVYSGESFANTDRPRPIDRITPASTSKRPTPLRKNLHIIENIDEVLDGVGPGREIHRLPSRQGSARANLAKFVNHVDAKGDLLILATCNPTSWWQMQNWIGKVEKFWKHGVGRTMFAPQRQNRLDQLDVTSSTDSLF